MSKPPDELSARRQARDEQIAAALSIGMTYADAAAAAGSSERTVRRKMADASFRTMVQGRRAERASQLSGLLLAAAPAALEVLVDLLREERPADRWRAAQTLLIQGRSLRNESDLGDRLAAVEQAIQDKLDSNRSEDG